MTTRTAVVALGAILALAALAADPEETPKDVGMLERATTRLAQLDVTVAGPKGAIEGLTASDFEVRIDHELVPNILVDDLCVVPAGVPATAPEDTPPVVATPTVAPPKANGATYLVYFDMPHLTQTGRRDAIDDAREMLPKLLAGGNRAMIVANARALKTVVPLTSNVAQLGTALAALVNDASAFDTYASLEETRMSDIIYEMSSIGGGIESALKLARIYADDERWRQERDLRRLSMVLGRFADVDPPKAVLYFADTMRQNAGEHYLSFFGGETLKDKNGRPTPNAAVMLANAATGALPLDRVINEASGLGIRFYTIEGQGMTGTELFMQSGTAHAGGNGTPRNTASPKLNFQRTSDAQGTLVSLAAETGGRAFLNGVTPSRMAAQILGDISCVYLLSFDPKGFKQDAPLSVTVTIKRPKVKANVRGRLVVQSDGKRLTGRVLSAFASPEAEGASSAGVHVGLIPISYKDEKFRARVQVAMTGSTVPITTWDLGASLVSQGVVRQDGSGRIQVTLPNTPVVYEQDMDFSAGDYDLIAVAHEVETDTLASKEIHGRWPKLDVELASLGPIAVSQRLSGGFLRNGQNRTQGALVVAEDQLLRGDSPTAVIALVCRAKDQKRPLRVARMLVGETSTPVGTTMLDLTTERCGQIVDLIPPRMLGAGTYHFVITVFSDGIELTRGERTLVVPESTPAPARRES